MRKRKRDLEKHYSVTEFVAKLRRLELRSAASSKKLRLSPP